MEFATLAAFLVVATALCLGDRGIRAHLARRGGEAGPNPQRPTYALVTAIKLLGRRPDRGPFRHGAPEFLELLVGGLPVLAPLLALATVPFGRDLQVIRSSAGVLVSLAALGLAAFGHQMAAHGTTAAPPPYGSAAARRSIVLLINVGVILIGAVMIPGTADLAAIVDAQQSFAAWLVWRQPIGLALIVLALLLAEGRGPAPALPAPFDSEGRSVLHSLAAVLTRVFLAAFVASLYLGGWSPGLALSEGAWWTLLSVMTFAVKTLLVLYAVTAIGRALPRPRPDQEQRLGWTMILPCAVANVLLTAAGVTLNRMFFAT